MGTWTLKGTMNPKPLDPGWLPFRVPLRGPRSSGSWPAGSARSLPSKWFGPRRVCEGLLVLEFKGSGFRLRDLVLGFLGLGVGAWDLVLLV